MANRMSPAGISMFYGAFDIATAIKETYEPSRDKTVISGIFKPIKPLTVIDQSEKLYVPSLFDKHKSDIRSDMKFLIEFINDFKKPIERGNKTHVEYVPTQVVTEYIRYSFKNSTKEKIDGIIYPSSKNEGQKALVIFANSDQCVEQEEATEDGAILQLCSVENHPL